MIGHSMLIRRGLPVTLVIAAAIMMQPQPASAGGYFSLSIGHHYPYHGYHHGHHSYWIGYARPYPYRIWAPVLVGEAPSSYRAIGAVKLKVRPKKTDVYVDGQYVGRSGQFDGYPGFLWLEAGRHTLTFYKDGYRTFDQSVEVRAETITDVRFAMVPGEATLPEPPPERAGEPRPAPARAVPEALPVPSAVEGAPSERTIVDLRDAGGRVRLAIEPADASVYLDGRFLGTGSEIARLHGGLLIEAGEHVVEVVHPRHPGDRVSFRVEEGEDLEVRIDLGRDRDRD